MRALTIRRSGAPRGGRCLRRCDHFDIGTGKPDRRSRQGSAGHRRSPDRPRHRFAARRQRAPGSRARRAISPGRLPTTSGRASCSESTGVLIGIARGAVRGAPDRSSAQGHRQGDPRARRRREARLDPRHRRATTRSATSRAPPKCSAARWSTPTPRAKQPVRALAEQRLAEESYRKLFEGSVDGIYVTTPAGALLNANPALARIMGYETPEALISGISDIAQHDLRSSGGARGIPVADAARRHGARIRISGAPARRRDPLALRQRHRRCATKPARSIRYEGTVRDITDQKRAEDAIAEGRRLLQQVIDTVPAVINVKDKQLRYVLMNRYMAGIFGIEPADAIGRTTSDLMSRYGAQKTDENDQAGAEGGQGARILRGGISGFRRQSAAMAGQQAAAARCRRRDREHRHRRARHRRAQARRTGDAQGQGCRRGGVAQSARDPELADRGRKARRARAAGGGRRPRGQQSRRHQPDGCLVAGAQDRDVRRRSGARRSQAIVPE